MVFFSDLLFNQGFKFILVEQTIEEAEFNARLRRAKRKVFCRVIELVAGHAETGCHVCRHLRPNVLQQRRQLFAVRRAHALPGERLHSTFVGVVWPPDHRDINAGLLEHPLEERCLETHARKLSVSVRVQVGFVGCRGEVQPAEG